MTAIRIEEGVVRSARVSIEVDGRAVAAHAGESLAAALLAADVAVFRRSPRAGTPRAPFCMMGTCQECVLRVDGVLRQSCTVAVHDGMAVTLG